MKKFLRVFVRMALMVAAPCLLLLWWVSYDYGVAIGYGHFDAATPAFWHITVVMAGGQFNIDVARSVGNEALDMRDVLSDGFRNFSSYRPEPPSPANLNEWGWVDSDHSGFNGVIAGCGYRWFANNGTQTTIWFNDIFVHMWLVCAAYFAAVALIIYRARRRRMRQRSGLCHKCNYDLRASKDRCPECGTAIPAPETDGTGNPSSHPAGRA